MTEAELNVVLHRFVRGEVTWWEAVEAGMKTYPSQDPAVIEQEVTYLAEANRLIVAALASAAARSRSARPAGSPRRLAS